MTSFAQWLASLLQATAFPMTPPRPYGAFHLTFTFVGLAISLFAAWKLRNIGQRKGRILIFCVGLFLFACEVYKQLFYTFCIDEVGYKWWIFPFQMCSVPMYLCLIAPLLKPGKVSRAMYNFMTIFNLLGGFITYFEPSGISLPYWSLTLHAYTWHMVLVFLGLFLNFAGFGGRKMKDYWTAAATFAALCVVAFCINLLLWDVAQGDINMFFIGPKESSLVVFSDISVNCGWLVNALVYIPVVCLGAFLIFLPFHLWSKRKAPAAV